MLDPTGKIAAAPQDEQCDRLAAPPPPLEQFFTKEGLMPGRFDDRRQHPRRYFRIPARARLQQSLAAFPRESQELQIYISDISRGGLCILCDRQLYPGEFLELHLPSLGPRWLRICRCLRLQAGCFAVGGQFSERDEVRVR